MKNVLTTKLRKGSPQRVAFSTPLRRALPDDTHYPDDALVLLLQGHHAQTVYTLTQPPSPGPPFMASGVPTYPGGMSGMSYFPHYMGPMMAPVGHPRTRYQHRQHRHQHQVPTLPSDERLRRDRRHRGERDRDADKPRAKPKPRAVTEDDVARTYTGLDRRIAEEFIMAMDSRQAQHQGAATQD
ncbi:Transposon Ty1-MR1 Gag-Pol polyprotein [Frankliniella fusca]|uniref:Transposon Ty1-MR1 Gag-Pol polyprotein n=1 Tax=Frankliniella fusca TaxID=407009 RepID=A0AAE1LBF0_9NEOP|nr:Transposon Ty1-MR1 Gag-Pol polyprotein [Frankliniella fusca]